MKYDVFISYSRKDYVDENKQVIPNNVISQLKELFQANHITYWIDEDGIYSGDAFATVITQNIKLSTLLLFVSSKHSNKSDWTSKEIALAQNCGKKVIPLRIDNSPYKDSLELYLSDVDYIDYPSNPSMAMSKLLSAIRNQLNIEADRKEQARKKEEERRKEEIERQEWMSQLTIVRKELEDEKKKLTDAENKIIEYKKSLEAQINLRDKYKKRIIGLKQKELDLERSLGLIVEAKQNPLLENKSEESVELKWNVNWVVKGLYLLVGIVAFVLACYFVYNGIKLGYTSAITAYLAFTFSSLISVMGVIRVLKNYRDGFIWLMISIVSLNILEFLTLIWTKAHGRVNFTTIMSFDRITIIGCSIGVCVMLALPLFFPRNGSDVWSQMKTPSIPLKEDRLRLIGCVLFVLMALALVYNRIWPYFKDFIDKI